MTVTTEDGGRYNYVRQRTTNESDGGHSDSQ